MVRFDAELRRLLGEIIAEMSARGEAPAELDPEAEARMLFAFNLSLNMDVRMQPERYTDEAVAAEVDDFLTRLTRTPRGEADAGSV